MTHTTLTWLASAFAFGLVACGTATPAPTDAASNEDRIHPEGDETMATIVVELPADSCLPGGACSKRLGVIPTFTLGTTALTLGAATRVVPGDYTLSVQPGGTTMRLALAAGATRRVVLPVARRVCRDAARPAIASPDFGYMPSLSNAACPSSVRSDGHDLALGEATFSKAPYLCYDGSCSAYTLIEPSTACAALDSRTVVGLWVGGYIDTPDLSAVAACQRVVAGDCAAFSLSAAQCFAASATSFLNGYSALTPGDYDFAVAGGTDRRTVRESDSLDLVFDLPVVGAIPDTFLTNVHFSSRRELPSAATANIRATCGASYSLSSATADLSLKAYKNAACKYALDAVGGSVELDQNATNALVVHRLDIDDVLVTRDDHTTYAARGTFEIYRGGSRVGGPYATNQGVDLLAGDYEVVVQYTTALGAQTKRYTKHF